MTAPKRRAGIHKALAHRFGVGGDALYAFVMIAVALTVSGLAAHVARQPLLFPSLGPTALLLFTKPLDASASPRDTVTGHAVAIGAGYGALALFGLREAPGILEAGVSVPRIEAAALSVAATTAALLLLRTEHPPAGATTLIVSLGLLARPPQLLMIALGVLLLTVVSWLLNRALGVPVPLWRITNASQRDG